MKRMTLYSILALTLGFSLFAACSGSFSFKGTAKGTTSTQPTTAVLTLSSTVSGSIPAGTVIGGYDVVVTLPEGVTVKSAAPPQTDAGVVTAVGAGIGSSFAASYIAASGSAKAKVRIMIAKGEGINIGKFIQINCDITAGHSPAISDFPAPVFTVSGFDTNSNSTVDVSGRLTLTETIVLNGDGSGNGAQQQVAFQTVRQGSVPSNGTMYVSNGIHVLRSVSEWSDFWDLLYTHASPRPPLPSVDFTKNVVIAAVDTSHTSGGFSITITGVLTSATGVSVQAVQQAPGQSCGVTTALDQPFHIVRAPIFFGEASLSLTKQVVDCVYPRTEQEIKDEFKVIVDNANSCSTNEQCVMIDPGCPLGCAAFINANEKERVQQAADGLIQEWSYLGNGQAQSCAYSCIQTGPAVCISGKCQVQKN